MERKSIPELLKFSIINIDKPSGHTSFQVSQYVKNYLGLNKTSHFGTLDPMVSGVLPVALGRACRLNEYFMHKNKTYVGIMRLHSDVSDNQLNEVIKNFIGKIIQMPPVRSRVKRAERIREVMSFKILERNDKDILFETEVQAGTYIRKICDDMGKELGGAHMLELRRIKAGIFEEKNSFTLYDLDKALSEFKLGNEEQLRKMLIPADEAIKKVLPQVQVKSSSVKKLLTGKPLMKNDLAEKEPDDEIYAIFSMNTFIGAVRKSHEGDIIARAEFIFN